MEKHFQRNSQLRKARMLKKPIHYIRLNQLEFNTLYNIDEFTVSGNKPILKLSKENVDYIVFLPRKYGKLYLNDKLNYCFEYFGNTLINSDQEFLIYWKCTVL